MTVGRQLAVPVQPSRGVHRIVTEGITPEHAVDEAIARITQILSD
jgi:hypothetical protein